MVTLEGMDALKNRLTSENVCQQKSRISQRWEWTLCLAGCLSLPRILSRYRVQNDEAEGGKLQRRRDGRDEVGPGILEYHIHCCFVTVFRDHVSFWSSNWANSHLTYVCQDYH